ncbi:uncharacterized protein PG998_005575 [Apiospora kogelbergensis]|uniref:Uncharacterized protein n=1 Tax=Apiospora kogelbergensis TaxID=1337665 RepID=A0AAW0R2U2_9PEZI
MCSTVQFTYSCGCAYEVVFECLLPHLPHHVHQDVGEEREAKDEKEKTADDNGYGRRRMKRPTPRVSPTEMPPTPTVVVVATSLDEECQECAVGRHDTSTDSDDGSSSSNSHGYHDHRDMPGSISPSSAREGEVVTPPVENMLPPPLPIRLRPHPPQQGQIRRPRFQQRGSETASGRYP